MRRYQYLFGLAAVILVFGLVSANAAFGKPYYQGKTIVIMCPHNPGGGTDTAARILARHLPRFIPGNPTVIVRNMLGGGGMLAPNYVATAAKPDGLTAFIGSSYTGAHDLLRTKGIRYDYAKMPVAVVVPAGEIYVSRPSKLPKPEDIVKVGKDLIFGYGPMPIGQTMNFMLAKELLGFQTKKDVLAFSGSSDSRRAFLAGEIDIYTESVISYAASSLPYVKKGEAIPLFQSGLYDANGVLKRQPGVVADVPTIKELYERIHGKSPSGPYWDAIATYIMYCRTLNKPVAFTPGTEKYVAIVRKAGVAMAKDPEFKKDYDKVNPGAGIYVGDDATKIMKIAAEKSKHIRPWLQDWITKGWGIKFEK